MWISTSSMTKPLHKGIGKGSLDCEKANGIAKTKRATALRKSLNDPMVTTNGSLWALREKGQSYMRVLYTLLPDLTDCIYKNTSRLLTGNGTARVAIAISRSALRRIFLSETGVLQRRSTAGDRINLKHFIGWGFPASHRI